MSDWDWSWITRAIDDLTMNFGDPFLQIGNSLHYWLGVLQWLVVCGTFLATGRVNWQRLWHLIGTLLITGFMLHYYSNPMPFSHYSFKTFLPGVCADLANIIENSRFDQVMQRVIDIGDNLEQPSMWNVPKCLTYALVEADMWFVGAVLMIPIAIGFIALGLGSILWPVAIPFLIIPRVAYFFWGPLNYMVKFSLYRVFAAAFTYVWAGIYVLMLDHLYKDVGTTYSLAQFTTMTMVVLVMLNGALILGVVKLTDMVGDFVNGGSGSGGGVVQTLVNARI